MKKRDFGTIVQIGDCLISEDVFTEYFYCDYAKCKGACCIIGESGAPLEESELESLESEYDHYSFLMRQEGKDAVSKKGFFEIDVDGDIVTPLVDGSEECAYSHFDSNGNCLCSIEKCYEAGICKFRKPISCYLYPIRITKLSSGMLALNVHHWDICKDVFLLGRIKKVHVFEFLREPLIARFGEDFYSALLSASIRVLAAS
jgi:hypothetical protein